VESHGSHGGGATGRLEAPTHLRPVERMTSLGVRKHQIVVIAEDGALRPAIQLDEEPVGEWHAAITSSTSRCVTDTLA
jgi:hypothetical protein